MLLSKAASRELHVLENVRLRARGTRIPALALQFSRASRSHVPKPMPIHRVASFLGFRVADRFPARESSSGVLNLSPRSEAFWIIRRQERKCQNNTDLPSIESRKGLAGSGWGLSLLVRPCSDVALSVEQNSVLGPKETQARNSLLEPPSKVQSASVACSGEGLVGLVAEDFQLARHKGQEVVADEVVSGDMSKVKIGFEELDP